MIWPLERACVASSGSSPPLSTTRTAMGRPMNWRAIVIPAAPAPMMQMSVSSTVPVGICRRSMNMAVPVLAEGDEGAEVRLALRQHPAIDDGNVAVLEIDGDGLPQLARGLLDGRGERALETRTRCKD